MVNEQAIENFNFKHRVFNNITLKQKIEILIILLLLANNKKLD